VADILIVEDNDAISRTYTQALEIHGHTVRVAIDEQNLREEMVVALPDLLLLDIGLPGMDGIEILRQLREEPETCELRVAVLSNYTDRKIIHRVLRMDALDYVEKASITPSLLAGQVDRWLEK
jgi:DNA-binding response OmpR family regulator